MTSSPGFEAGLIGWRSESVMVRSRSCWRRRLPCSVIVAAVTASLGAGLLVLVGCGGPPAAHEADRPSPGRPALPAGSYPEGPLAVGAAAPDFAAAGWLNGAPPARGDGGARLVVVDVWAHW